MKYRLLDILACPICKNFPLRFYIFEEEKRYEPSKVTKCELFCAFHKGMISELDDTNCIECYKYEIVSALLSCEKCGRWYPVIDEIPVMLPDELRDERRDLDFLKKWSERIPEEILREGKPYCLK